MVIENKENVGRKSFCRQLALVLIISLGTFIAGCMHGWTAPALIKLQSGNEIINISAEDGSYIALYSEFGHFISPIPAGITSDIVGRKPVFIFSSFLALAGWGVLLFAASLDQFLIGRTLLGFHYGIHCSMMNIYVAEITSKQIRGTFGSLVYMFNGIGILFQFFMGGYFSLRSMAICTFLICCVHFVLVLFIIESPYYQVATKKTEQAQKNLAWLRAASQDQIISEEFSNIVKRVQIKEGFIKSCKNLISPTSRKSFFLCLIISWLNDMTGRIPILTYATENFKSLGSSSANIFTILLGFCNALLPFASVLSSDKIGRKIIIVITAIIAGTALFGSGLLYFLHLKTNMTIPLYGWLLFVSITTYLSCCSIFTTNILTLRGELIAENSRGLASGFMSMAFASATVMAIKIFQITRDSYGIYCAFWLLCAFSFVLATFTVIFIPETKNKTFEEIQNLLYSKHRMQIKNSARDPT